MFEFLHNIRERSTSLITWFKIVFEKKRAHDCQSSDVFKTTSNEFSYNFLSQKLRQSKKKLRQKKLQFLRKKGIFTRYVM